MEENKIFMKKKIKIPNFSKPMNYNEEYIKQNQKNKEINYLYSFNLNKDYFNNNSHENKNHINKSSINRLVSENIKTQQIFEKIDLLSLINNCDN